MSFILQRVRDDPGAGAGEIARTSMVQFVEQPMLVIGRGANADLRFSEASVALAHAVIRPLAAAGGSPDGGLEVADTGSLTGTYLNGKRVDRAPLANGDWLEIGRHRLSVQVGQPGAPHTIFIRELAAEISAAREAAAEVPTAAPPALAAGAPVRATAIDYLAAYGLDRPLLSRGALTVWAVALVGAVLVGVLVSRQTAMFRPGPVSSAHAPIADDCAACHAGWRGPDDRRCTVCHAAPAHQPGAVVPAGIAAAPPIGPLADRRDADSPSCGSCHVEHRFEPILARVDNARCVSCHRALTVRDGRPAGGGPRFAVQVTDFAVDHPQFALDVLPASQPAAAPTRITLDREAARQGDPAVFWLNHALHLRPDLKGSQGPEQLDCLRSCHTPDRASDAIVPVNYERNCQRCHRLVFDPRFPDAPHTSAEKLHAFLVRTYAEKQERAQPLRIQRRLLPRGGGSDASGDALAAVLDVDARVLRQVVEAEINLYRSACAKCHEVDLGGATPAITPIGIPRRWFPYASFSHQSHRQSACTLCHGGALTSKDTSDVLLPGIEVCRTCHGPRTTATGPRAGATTQCVRCHAYHDASRTGAWGKTPRGVWEADSGLPAAR